MNLVVGWLIAVASALFGYVALGGSVSLLWVPAEYLIIFGAALGTLVAGNKLRNLKNLFVSVVRIFLKQSRSKSKNLALLCLMFELLQKIKRDGNLALEPDIENPHGSPLFTKYPAPLAKEGKLGAWNYLGHYQDLGTVADLKIAEEILRTKG